MWRRHEVAEQIPIPDIDSLIHAQEAKERREDLFHHITEAPHVGVTELAPYVTILPDLAKPLAVRCDPNFNVTQALYGIVRAGSHGIALATAFGSDRTKPGRSYVTHINEDPYGKQTRLVGPLLPGVRLLLGGNSTLVPELATEKQKFMVSADEKGEIRVKADRLGALPFQLITSVIPLSHRSATEHMPLDEVGTWSLPPSYIKRVLRLK